MNSSIFFLTLIFVIFQNCYGKDAVYHYITDIKTDLPESSLVTSSHRMQKTGLTPELNVTSVDISNNSFERTIGIQDTASRTKNASYSAKDLIKIILAKGAGIVWKRIHESILKNDLSQKSENNFSKYLDNDVTYNRYGFGIDGKRFVLKTNNESIPMDKENETSNDKALATARQFLFHPYLPYDKEAEPDEKLSIHDVLPVKMVKFIKSMVEDAPWEQMFMKMVRMVVDQFVDKIIEKMFAHKDEEDDKWRSLDGVAEPNDSSPKLSLTRVIRLRRSVDVSKSDKEDEWISSSFSSENRLSKDDKPKDKKMDESDSWLDAVLEYLFPEDSKDEALEEFSKTRRRRSESVNSEPSENLTMSDILNTFFIKLYEFQTGELASEQFKLTLKNVIRHQLLQSVLQAYSVENNTVEPNASAIFEELSNSLKSVPTAVPERLTAVLKPESEIKPDVLSGVQVRLKRSTDKEDSRRLWQWGKRNRPNIKMRDECSLRRACNTGRLLARLPSVQDITMQLKSYGNEPHWDALVWGMTKKKCSKIFCKRQRSPKGSKHRWDMEDKHNYRNDVLPTRRPRFHFHESAATTISSL